MMPNLDAKIRDSELNADKLIKHQNEILRREQLNKILKNKNQKDKHQIIVSKKQPNSKSTKTEQAKNIANNLKILVRAYPQHTNKKNKQEVKMPLITKHGKTKLSTDDTNKLKNLKMLSKLNLINCTSFKIHTMKSMPKSKDINNDYTVGHIVYKYSYKPQFFKLMRKYIHSKSWFYRIINASNNGFNKICDHLGLLSFSSWVSFSIITIELFKNFRPLSNLFEGSLILGGLLTIFALIVFVLWGLIISGTRYFMNHHKIKEFLAHKKSIIKDLQKNTSYNVLDVLKKK